MIVVVLEKVPVGLRGELSRWLLELRTGVFVGTVSAAVRDRLWEKVAKSKRKGAAMLIYATKTEQGFSIRSSGEMSRTAEDFDGLFLMRTP